MTFDPSQDYLGLKTMASRLSVPFWASILITNSLIQVEII